MGIKSVIARREDKEVMPCFLVTSPTFCTRLSETVYITTSSGKDATGGSQGAVGDRRAASCGANASLKASETASSTTDETLQQAKNVAERDLANWRQSKWFDLYVRARELGTELEHFQTIYKGKGLDPQHDHKINKDYNDLMRLNRRCMAMAVVFPKNDVIDKLARAAAAFRDWKEALSSKRLELIEDSIEEIRALALLRPEVVLPPEMQEQIKTMMTGKFDGVLAPPKTNEHSHDK